MFYVRKSSERGHFNHGWLKTYHSFSFAEYHDPKFMGYGPLRVINEDEIAPGTGFSTHGHQNMEIITVVTAGALEHKDTMGNTSIIRPGEVQKMSAGTGVRHSEFNHSKTDATKLLQIWLLPDKNGYEPSYDQQSVTEKLAIKDLVLVASKEGREGSIKINQQTDLYIGQMAMNKDLNFSIKNSKNKIWLQMIEGEIQAGDIKLSVGDGLAATDLDSIKIRSLTDSHFLLFDMRD